MEQSDKQELMSAIKDVAGAVAALSDRVDTLGDRVDTLGDRVDTLGDRVDTLGDQVNERIDALTKEVRSGYEHLDRRLEAVEENTAAMSSTMDKLLAGDTLGTNHITLTRPEYDALTDTCHLPNRFLAHTAGE